MNTEAKGIEEKFRTCVSTFDCGEYLNAFSTDLVINSAELIKPQK